MILNNNEAEKRTMAVSAVRSAQFFVRIF